MINIIQKIQYIGFQLKNMNFLYESIIGLVQNNNIQNISFKIEDLWIQILNLGVKTLNIAMEMPYAGMSMPNKGQQLQNVINQINSIEMNMNKNIQILSTNLMMPVNMNNMIEKQIPYFPLNNMGMANNDIENNKMSNNEYIVGPIYSIRFVENNGNTTIVILENENTINEMLESYLQKKGKVEIIGKNNKIYFMLW